MQTEQTNEQVESSQSAEAAPAASEPASKALSQKEAVRKFANEAAAELNLVAAGGALRALLQSDGEGANKELRAKVRAKLYAGFKDGSVAIKSQKADGDLKKYCSSLINNWLKKDNFFA